MAWRKNLTNIFTYRRGGGNVCPPYPDGVEIAYVQTG